MLDIFKYSIILFLCFISCKDVKKNKCDITESQELTSTIYKNTIQVILLILLIVKIE